MKYLHNLEIKVFSKNEPENLIEKGFDFITPFDFQKENLKIDIKEYKSDSENQNVEPIKINSLFIDKQRFLSEFIKHIRKLFNSEQKKRIINNAEKYMDDDCRIYIRLDKDALLKNHLELVEHGNCYHINMNIAAFPKKKEKALEIIKEIFV